MTRICAIRTEFGYITKNNMIPMIDACTDKPDSRDFLFDDVFGATPTLPTKVDNARTTVFDQSVQHDPSTAYACTCYAMTHATNEWNAIEAERSKVPVFGQIDPVNQWKLALKRGAKVDEGWTLQGACNMAKDLGYIDGYVKCADLSAVKKALAAWQMIQTGSKKINWQKTTVNNYAAVPGDSYGHSFMCEWYDDDARFLIMRNSYGENYGNNGRFHVAYDNFDLLFSCYAYTDKVNSYIIKSAQSVARRFEAKARWIWNGDRGDDICTKFEAATMAMRATGQATTKGIWNGRDWGMKCSRYDATIMLQLWSGRLFKFQVWSLQSFITRWEMAELSVRI